MKSWAQRSLQGKFFILTIPLVLLVNLAFFAAFETIEIRSQLDALKKKQESIVKVQGIKMLQAVYVKIKNILKYQLKQ